MAKICLCAVALVVMLALTACGGSKSASGSSNASSSGGNGKVSQADCQALGEAVSKIQLLDLTFGFDYAKTRTFFDNFNPPDKIRDDSNRIKDFVDKVASAEEDAAVKSGDAPVGDQISKLQETLPHYSDVDKARNGQALTSLDGYVSNGCD